MATPAPSSAAFMLPPRARLWSVGRLFTPPDPRSESDRKLFAIRIAASLIEGLVHVMLAGVFAILAEPWAVWLNLLSVLVFVGSVVALRKGRETLGLWLALAEIAVHLPLFTFLLGPRAGYMLYVVGFPLSAFIVLRPEQRLGRLLLFAYTLGMPLAVLALSTWLGPLRPIEAWKIDALFLLNMAGAMIAVSFTSWFVGRASDLAELHLDAERRRSDRLLERMLPVPIAHRLKQQAGTIADSLPDVTVLFADIVGFTVLSQQIESQRLVELLNDIFTEFDRLAERHGVEKIKTIGDAYMVVGGAPEPQEDHARAIARMALDMREALRKYTLRVGQPLDMRIGIHTGPVVAGVIGEHKFAYDLWGDTVNTASRLESHGEPGRIQISAATRDRLGGAFRVGVRGSVQLKGKGQVDTWWLEGEAEPHAPVAAA